MNGIEAALGLLAGVVLQDRRPVEQASVDLLHRPLIRSVAVRGAAQPAVGTQEQATPGSMRCPDSRSTVLLDPCAVLLDVLHVEPRPGDQALVVQAHEDDPAGVEQRTVEVVPAPLPLRPRCPAVRGGVDDLGGHVGDPANIWVQFAATCSGPLKPRFGCAGCSLR